MIDQDILLFPVFEKLKHHGVPLGISEYVLAVKMVREGMGLEDIEQFKRVCRLLWAKSREDQELFDVAFADFIEPHLKPTIKSSVSENLFGGSSSSDSTQRDTGVQPTKDRKQPKKVVPKKHQNQIAARSVPIRRSPILKSYPVAQKRRYHLSPRLPLGRREMAGAWRYLRQLKRIGPVEELDVEGTINSICRTGFFLHPLLQPRKRNQARVVVLVDQQGSMEPFSMLIETLVESIERGGLLGKVNVYYFHDVLEGFLYKNPGLTGQLVLDEILSTQAKERSVLIVSDAGAARGYYDKRRVDDTRKFLETLNTYTYLYAWLNPMPIERWVSTTAEDIARLIPMFHLDRNGLNDTVNILRGHPFPPEVNLNA